MTSLSYGLASTPVGTALIGVTDAGLLVLEVTDAPPEHVLEPAMRRLGVAPRQDQGAVESVAWQLQEYFDGDRRDFDIAIDWSLTRGFTTAALQAVREIPYGEKWSYGEVAVAAGAPRAHRAVGTACARTPISIVVPAHRVVRADGTLGEYGGRPELKRHLIGLEHAVAGSAAGE